MYRNRDYNRRRGSPRGMWSLGLWFRSSGLWGVCRFLIVSANFCFGTPVLFMRAWACVALSGWRVKNYCEDNTRKSLGPVVYKMRVPRAGKQLAGSSGYNSIELAVIVDWSSQC